MGFRGLGFKSLGFGGLGFRGFGFRGRGFGGLGFKGLGFKGGGFRGLGPHYRPLRSDNPCYSGSHVSKSFPRRELTIASQDPRSVKVRGASNPSILNPKLYTLNSKS